MASRFGPTPSFCRTVATVFNEELPKNYMKALNCKPNGGGNISRVARVRTATGGNENTGGVVFIKGKEGPMQDFLVE